MTTNVETDTTANGAGTKTSPAAATDRFTADRRLTRTVDIVGRFALVALLIASIVVFGVWKPDTFFSMANVRSILFSQAVLAILAMSAIFPLVVGQFDLSLAATLGLASLTCAILLSRHGLPLILAIICALAVAALIGFINGIVVTRFGVNSIITTLGSASAIGGVATWYSNGNTISSHIPANMVSFGTGQWLGLPRPAFVVAALALIIGYVLRLTPTGRKLYAVGANPRAAALVGLPVKRLTVLALTVGALVAGAGGILGLADTGSADPGFGPSLLLPGLTAVFLGATAIRPGQYNVLGTLIALLFIATSLSGLTLVGAPDYIQPIYEGVTLIVAVAGSTVMRRARSH